MASAAEYAPEETLQRLERLEQLVTLLQGILGNSLAGAAIQFGSAALVNGVSAAIAAKMSATSVIMIGVGTAVGDANTVSYAALSAERVNGDPGSFVIRAFTAAGREVANTNAADQSTDIEWVVIGPAQA